MILKFGKTSSHQHGSQQVPSPWITAPLLSICLCVITWTSLVILVDVYSINVNQSHKIASQIYSRLLHDGYAVLIWDYSTTADDNATRELLSVKRESCLNNQAAFLTGLPVQLKLLFCCSCCLLWRCDVVSKPFGTCLYFVVTSHVADCK